MVRYKEKRGYKSLNRGKGVEGPVSQIAIGVIAGITIILVALPVIITVLNSLKTNYEATVSIWSIPRTPRWSNWAVGLHGMVGNMLNSVAVCLAATGGIVFLSSLTAYVLVRHSFPGKEVIFFSIIALMIVPGVLSLTPQYLLVMNLGIKNTWWALVLPYISGGQIGAIFLFRTFLSQQPAELFEAARIDGAGEFTMYARIAIPLAVPVLTIQAVSSFAVYYNDFLWPTLVIDQENRQTLMPILKALTTQVSGTFNEQGTVYAMYLLSGIPLIFTTVFGLKYFINGEFASGLKL